MTDLHTHEAATGTGDRSRPRAALPALCATQITSWGIVYYAFPVLLPHLTAETGWSKSAATAAFSAALLVSAIAGIPVGRILDRRGPRAVMTTGSLLAVAAVPAIALAPNLYMFTAAWLMAGVAMAAHALALRAPWPPAPPAYARRAVRRSPAAALSSFSRRPSPTPASPCMPSSSDSSPCWPDVAQTRQPQHGRWDLGERVKPWGERSTPLSPAEPA